MVGDVRMLAGRFQHAGVRHPRGQRKQPHQHRHECGVAFGALVSEGPHFWCELLAVHATAGLRTRIDPRQTRAGLDVQMHDDRRYIGTGLQSRPDCRLQDAPCKCCASVRCRTVLAVACPSARCARGGAHCLASPERVGPAVAPAHESPYDGSMRLANWHSHWIWAAFRSWHSGKLGWRTTGGHTSAVTRSNAFSGVRRAIAGSSLASSNSTSYSSYSSYSSASN